LPLGIGQIGRIKFPVHASNLSDFGNLGSYHSFTIL
jgi:hypothetical protein